MAGVKLKPFSFIYDDNKKMCLENGHENAPLYTTINNESTPELKTNYQKANGETVLTNNTSNSFIVLGRDRNAGISSGAGGAGWTGASSIDIIAGHMGGWPISSLNGEPIFSSKDFKRDGSRVYLSHLCDVDSYFSIPKVQVAIGNDSVELENSFGFSTAAIKADTSRIIARENIKLVTLHKEMGSQGIKTIKGGIDIMAGCDVMGNDRTLDLQPMVKGNNLIELLQTIIAKIDETQNNLTNFMNLQKDINDIVSRHTHQSNKAGLASSDMNGKGVAIKNFKLLTDVLPNILKNYVNSIKIDSDYLKDRSPKYIISRWNRVN